MKAIPVTSELVNLLASEDALDELKDHASRLPSIQLSERAVCDLELLAVGGFSPLDRFVSRADHERVVHEMRLADGALFPIPITLPFDPATTVLSLDRDVALRNAKNDLLAILTVEDVYEWDRDAVAANVFGTLDLRHPLVVEMRRWGPLNISGRLQVLRLPPRYDFRELRLTPVEVRQRLAAARHENVVAFQTRNPLHRVHEELTKRALDHLDATLLLHPSVGMTRPGDVDHYTRVRTYRALAERHYPPDRVVLALLPLAMRMAGPREALWHALIRRNYGANYFIVGRDHASPGVDSSGKPFYGPYDAQLLLRQYEHELGVSMVPFQQLVYLPDSDAYAEATEVPPGARTATISGTQVREEYLNRGRPLPEWFTRPETAEILAETYPPRHRQGVCVWFTGLSGAGKSTTAEVLTMLLLEHGRQATLLDGDVVRTHLSRGLGFSREDRDTNIRRIGFVASEIARHGGVAVCAAISPYRATRNEVREMVGADRFVEVFVDTPIEECERRDAKGMYAKARRGEISGWTGIDDPYEAPEHAEVVLDTLSHSAEDNARAIVRCLAERGFVVVRDEAANAGVKG
jgi:sulfate adenylyltransferase